MVHVIKELPWFLPENGTSDV